MGNMLSYNLVDTWVRPLQIILEDASLISHSYTSFGKETQEIHQGKIICKLP